MKGMANKRDEAEGMKIYSIPDPPSLFGNHLKSSVEIFWIGPPKETEISPSP